MVTQVFHGLSPRASIEEAVAYVVSVVEESGGQARFVGTGRTARRLMANVVAAMPNGYEAAGFGYSAENMPKPPFRSALVANFETLLHVWREGQELNAIGDFVKR